MSLILAVALTLTQNLALERSQAEKRHFATAHPCPYNKIPSIHCPGYVIDHIKPLCAGGPDKASNMQWQTKRQGYIKDGKERVYCACLKAQKPVCKVPW